MLPFSWNQKVGTGIWLLVLVRACLTLFTTLVATIGLLPIAIAWLDLMQENPPMDHIAESVIRFHSHISSGIFYAMIVYNLIDVVHVTETGRSIHSRIHLPHGSWDRILPSQYSCAFQRRKTYWTGPKKQEPPVQVDIPETEVQLNYQHTAMVVLRDALEEMTAAKENAEEHAAELQRQIVAQNHGIEQLGAELRQRRAVEQRDAEQIESLRAEIVQLSTLAGRDQTENRIDNVLHHTTIQPQPPRPRPLTEWRSHRKMFLTARIKPCRDDDLSHDRVPVSSVGVETDGPPSVVLHDPRTGVKTQHQFDHCFGPQDTNEAIWAEYRSLLVEGLAENYIVAVATDGPSGSGKTFTMFKGRDALISTTIHNVLQHESNNGRTVHVRAIEVYKNDAVDVVGKAHKQEKLGSPPKAPRRGFSSWKDYQALEFPQGSTLEYITNKTLVLNSRRTNKDTAMNTSRSPLRGGSSRGHLVVVVNYGDPEGNSNLGRLVFIDLAGTEERGVNDGDIDAEYDDIRKDRSDCYTFFKNFARNPTTYGDRMLIKLLKPLLRQSNRTTKVAHIFHISTTDHERNLLLMMQKKEIEQGTASVRSAEPIPG